ncbi:DNA polymerase IV [Ruminococcus sp. FC2018]|uniref:DNA polymerase IV n=1 Tax=Ruminococcus sp. FC2018 TaxID=1410617 RepID=UPI00048B0FB2|nr:DNA polymerase IV [Ruminococcus sp. FC2018]
MDQIIIHVDMDAFYASVEMRDDPGLRGKPLIIGSLPHERGVVATCSYEARKFGVRSGMNIKEAYRLCPQGIYMHPNFNKYRAVSDQLHDIWNTYASASQTIALDEAYLDVTQQAKDWDGARKIAGLIKQRTRDELHLTCSVGVAYSKTAAKTASEEKKPDGYFEILTPADFVRLIIHRDVRVLYTVGEKTAEKLHTVGINTVGDIRRRRKEVESMLGKHGRWITRIAFGIDDSKVTPYRPEDAKSIGREVTFQQDVSDFRVLGDVLLLLALCVENRAKRVGLQGKGINLKLTYGDMKTITRSRTTAQTDNAVVIYNEALQMLEQVQHRPVRLIGVGLHNLSGEDEPVQLSFDDLGSRMDSLPHQRAMLLDHLKERYKLDFAANLEKIYHWDTLHKTIEYMRKYKE